MAEFRDAEAALWRQAEHSRSLQRQFLEMQQIVAVLARRHAGTLVIEPREFMELPSGAVIISQTRPDGALVLRVETGEGDRR